jgi:hypothetical protein
MITETLSRYIEKFNSELDISLPFTAQGFSKAVPPINPKAISKFIDQLINLGIVKEDMKQLIKVRNIQDKDYKELLKKL